MSRLKLVRKTVTISTTGWSRGSAFVLSCPPILSTFHGRGPMLGYPSRNVSQSINQYRPPTSFVAFPCVLSFIHTVTSRLCLPSWCILLHDHTTLASSSSLLSGGRHIGLCSLVVWRTFNCLCRGKLCPTSNVLR